MSHLNAFGFAQNIEDGVERTQVLVAAMFVHRQEHLNSPVGFPAGSIPFRDDGKGSGSWAATEGPHSAHKGPSGVVIAHTGCDVNGVFETRRGMNVGLVAV